MVGCKLRELRGKLARVKIDIYHQAARAAGRVPEAGDSAEKDVFHYWVFRSCCVHSVAGGLLRAGARACASARNDAAMNGVVMAHSELRQDGASAGYFGNWQPATPLHSKIHPPPIQPPGYGENQHDMKQRKEQRAEIIATDWLKDIFIYRAVRPAVINAD